jgi:hypothetical protein
MREGRGHDDTTIKRSQRRGGKTVVTAVKMTMKMKTTKTPMMKLRTTVVVVVVSGEQRQWQWQWRQEDASCLIIWHPR